MPDPMIPSFGAPPPPAPPAPPAAPITPPAAAPMVPPAAPMVPQFRAPQPQQPAGNKWGDLATILPALLAGIKDPMVAGAALTGLQKGKDQKRAIMLGDQEHQRQQAQDAARFYGDALTHAQGFDDEIALQQYLQAVKPMADYYGVSLDGVTISNDKKAKKDRSLVQDAIDRAVKLHGPEILNNDKASIQLSDGRTFSMPIARQMLGGGVSQDGKSVPVPATTKVDTPNTSEEQFYQTFATEHGAPSFAKLTTAQQAEARGTWATSGRADAPETSSQRVEALVNGRRAFVFFDPKAKTFTDAQGKDVTSMAQPIPPASANGPRDRFNVQPVTNPDGSTGLVRVNLDTGEVTPVALPTGAGAGKASDTEKLSKAYLDRTIASDTTARGFEQALTALGDQVDVNLPNLLKSGQGQRYQQAKDEFINAALRRESGAAIQPSEYARYDDIYFVRPGDDLSTIKQKQDARARVVEGFRTAAGNMGRAIAPVPSHTPGDNPFRKKK